MDCKSAPPIDLAEWQRRQVEYTIPDTGAAASISADPLSKEVPHRQNVSRYALYAFLGLAVAGMGYGYLRCSMSMSAIKGVALATFTQATVVITGALLAHKNITRVGVGALACATLLGSIKAIMRLRAQHLSDGVGFMSANLFADAKLSLFEFFGSGYGEELDAYRARIFQAVLPAETFVRKMSREEILAEMKKEDPKVNPTDAEIEQFQAKLLEQACLKDLEKGPTLRQLAGCDSAFTDAQDQPFNVLEELAQLEKSINNPKILSQNDLAQFELFIKKFGHQKLFAFLHGINPHKEGSEGTSGLLRLDHWFRNITFPFLNEPAPIKAKNPYEVKQQLLHALFSTEVTQAKYLSSRHTMQIIREDLDLTLLKDEHGNAVTPEELEFFSTPAGLLFFNWLYHAEEWDLALKESTVDEFNWANKTLQALMGDPKQRAEKFVQDLLHFNVSVLAAQECGPLFAEELKKQGFIDPFNNTGASFTALFLREKRWKDIEPIKTNLRKLAMVLATDKQTKDRFLHVSAHSYSTDAKEGLEKIKEAIRVYRELQQQPGNKDLILMIGVDANTKETVDIEALQQLMQQEGLQITDYGPTTLKIRALTTQQEKRGKRIFKPGDHVITSNLKGRYRVMDRMLGWLRKRADSSLALPNPKHPSDHLTVLLVIQKLWSLRA